MHIQSGFHSHALKLRCTCTQLSIWKKCRVGSARAVSKLFSPYLAATRFCTKMLQPPVPVWSQHTSGDKAEISKPGPWLKRMNYHIRKEACSTLSSKLLCCPICLAAVKEAARRAFLGQPASWKLTNKCRSFQQSRNIQINLSPPFDLTTLFLG